MILVQGIYFKRIKTFVLGSKKGAMDVL